MTTETPSSETVIDDPTKPNLAGAVKMVKDRRTGEYRPAKKGGRPRKSGKRAPSSTSDSEPDAPIEVSEADIKGAGFLGAVVWKIVGTFTGNRALTRDEQGELGEALAPVLAKWLPDLNEFAPEIALVVTVWGLYETTKAPRNAEGLEEDERAASDPRMGSTLTLESPDDADGE